MRYSSFTATLMLASASLFAQTAPKVVSTWPTLDARDVDPTLKEIRVTFDQPMMPGSWSWCGGGRFFPVLDGKPSFIDAKTAVLPVKLEAGHSYILSINCPSGQSFVSEGRVPAIPYLLRFTTTSQGIQADPANAKALEELRQLIESRYSHAARTGTDWGAEFSGAKEWILISPDAVEWSFRVAAILRRADDPHFSIIAPDGMQFGTRVNFPAFNGNINASTEMLGKVDRPSSYVWTAQKGDIAYLAIHGWPKDESLVKPAHDFLDQLPASGAKSLIIDVRSNGGGDELVARAIAARFVDRTVLYSKNRTRNPDVAGGWTPVYDRLIEPDPKRAVRLPVYLLQGPVCLSSNESFIMMMKQSPRVKTLGATTGGSSGNPQEYKLANGVRILLPSWEDLLPDDSPLEGKGIPPEVPVTGDFAAGDPVLAKALEMAGVH